jgi:hypothetical protein
MKKYSANQINFAIWNHVEKHDDKREQYTLGILRNTSDDEVYRKLMRMLNRQNKDTIDYLAVVNRIWNIEGIAV